MKKTLIALSLFALPMTASLAASYTIDPAHTYPNFQINHLGFSTMHGRFGTTSGSMQLDPAAKQASVDIKIDAASIDTGHQKRDDHLRSPDFLSMNCGVHPFNKKELCGFDAEATIKRSDFGVNYGIPAIGDMMKLAFEVEAFKD